MKQVTLVVPGPITTRTGGSIYDRCIAEGLVARGWTVSVVELDAMVHPFAPPLKTAPAQFAAIPDDSLVLVDGLAFGTMPEIVEQEAWRLRFVPIVHMPLSTTPGLTPGESGWLRNLERRALTRARQVIITGSRSRPHVRTMTGWLDDDLIAWIPPGVDRPTNARASREGLPLRLLCVANLTFGKGHDILLRALSQTKCEGWWLVCAGSAARDPQAAERIRTQTHECGLDGRVRWAGELDATALQREYASADIFVLATRGETYGMAVAEAIAHGLPVVSTRTGEIQSIAGDGALLAEPGDVASFTTALATAMQDRERRQAMAVAAAQAASRLPTWEGAAEAMENVLNKVAAVG